MNNLNLGERLQVLRNEHGYSQEQLADLVGVSRQAVSKWETGASMPDVNNLVRLSELYSLSLDSIIKGSDWEPSVQPETATNEQVIQLDSVTSGILRLRLGSEWHYERKSKTTVFGIPLWHVNIGKRNGKPVVAKGIFAVGIIAVGMVSVGIISLGLLSIGMIALGLIAGGMLSAGIYSAGIATIGLFSFGVIACGYYATGVVAIGVYSGGVSAMGARVAVGVAACAPVAVGKDAAQGLHSMIVTGSTDEAYAVRRFIETNAPEISNYILNRLVNLSIYL